LVLAAMLCPAPGQAMWAEPGARISLCLSKPLAEQDVMKVVTSRIYLSRLLGPAYRKEASEDGKTIRYEAPLWDPARTKDERATLKVYLKDLWGDAIRFRDACIEVEQAAVPPTDQGQAERPQEAKGPGSLGFELPAFSLDGDGLNTAYDNSHAGGKGTVVVAVPEQASTPPPPPAPKPTDLPRPALVEDPRPPPPPPPAPKPTDLPRPALVEDPGPLPHTPPEKGLIARFVDSVTGAWESAVSSGKRLYARSVGWLDGAAENGKHAFSHLVVRVDPVARVDPVVRVDPVAQGLMFWKGDEAATGDWPALTAQYANTHFVGLMSSRYDGPLLFEAMRIQENAPGEPDAVGGVGELGLMQLLPTTAKWQCRKFVTDLTDPDQNVHCAAVYFEFLLERLGNPVLAVAAYNGGLGSVEDNIVGEKQIPYVREVFNRYRRMGGRRVDYCPYMPAGVAECSEFVLASLD